MILIELESIDLIWFQLPEISAIKSLLYSTILSNSFSLVSIVWSTFNPLFLSYKITFKILRFLALSECKMDLWVFEVGLMLCDLIGT